MRTLSPRESRLLAVLGLVAALALVQFAVVAPLLDGFSARAAEREMLRQRQSAETRLIAAVPRLGRIAGARRALLRGYVLAPADAAGASEYLRGQAQAAIAAVGGDYRGGEDATAGPGIAAVRVSARLTPAQLTALLVRLQNARPAIVVPAYAIAADDVLVTGKASAMDVQLEAQVPYSAARR